MITILAACSTNKLKDTASNNEKTSGQNQEETNEEGVNVDKGLFHVEVTIPASFFEGEDLDAIIADAEGMKQRKSPKIMMVQLLIKCLNLNTKK